MISHHPDHQHQTSLSQRLIAHLVVTCSNCSFSGVVQNTSRSIRGLRTKRVELDIRLCSVSCSSRLDEATYNTTILGEPSQQALSSFLPLDQSSNMYRSLVDMTQSPINDLSNDRSAVFIHGDESASQDRMVRMRCIDEEEMVEWCRFDRFDDGSLFRSNRMIRTRVGPGSSARLSTWRSTCRGNPRRNAGRSNSSSDG